MEDVAIGCLPFSLLSVLLCRGWARVHTESRKRGSFRLFAAMREESKYKRGALKISKATLIATLIAVVLAFSSTAKAQAPLKTKPSTKLDQRKYIITAHTVVQDDETNIQRDNYVIVYGSEVLRVQYSNSQISTAEPGASKLEHEKSIQMHTWYGSWPFGPDLSEVPQVSVPIRACEMDTEYPDSEGHPVIAIQSVLAPCMSRYGDTLHFVLAPNGGVKMFDFVVFDILEETNSVGVAAKQAAPPGKDIPAIAKAASASIVSIVMSNKDGTPIVQGSGFLVSVDGLILTNYHVIAEGSSALAKLPDGAFYVVDGVLSSDKARDVAVIKAHGENFRPLTLGNSDRLQVGEEVVAIGNPLSLESTVSNGILSGIRVVGEEGGKYLQITAPISPGSSGGPLFNMAGEVIGITTMYLKGGENLNFAIPINDAKRMLLTEFTQIQALPNEPEPVLGEAPAGDPPSAVASPPVQPPVEHAATAEQCEADAQVWAADLRSDDVVKQLSYSKIHKRTGEMSECLIGMSVDPTVRNVQNFYLYAAVKNAFSSAELLRLTSYIGRHDPWSQYMSEGVPFLSITQNLPKHAPTRKQCDADLQLWNQQQTPADADELSANELYVRVWEMQSCAMQQETGREAVARAARYLEISSVYNSVAAYRARSYLLRHNEEKQFVAEDAAGMR